MRRFLASLAALVLAVPVAGAAQERAIVLQGARILPVSGPEIPSGVLVVQGGRIVAVGRAGAIRAPAGAEMRDVRGKVLIPGLVDTHSHIGDGDGGDRSSPIQGEVRILDASANGLPREAALATITSAAAEIIGQGNRLGTLEVGKDGDVVLFDGDPFEYATHVCAVVIEGEVVSEKCR